LRKCDAGAEVACVGQSAGVDGHPLQAGGAGLVEEGGKLGVAGGGLTRQGQDRAVRGAISVTNAPQAMRISCAPSWRHLMSPPVCLADAGRSRSG
jgi:hypothetical protein